MITTAELARKVGKTKRWIQQLCKEGRIEAKKYGRDYLIADDEADRYVSLVRAMEDPADD